MLEDETHHKKKLEEEVVILRSQLSQLTFEAGQVFFLFIYNWCCCGVFTLLSQEKERCSTILIRSIRPMWFGVKCKM